MGWIEDNTSKDQIAKVDMRIRMLKMNPGEKDPIDEDLEGTITNIDGLGTLHVRWDDGRTLGVIPPIYHTVKNREKITDILKKYSVNLEDLMEWNDLKTMDIEKGQKLKIVIDEYELLPPLDDQIGLDDFEGLFEDSDPKAVLRGAKSTEAGKNMTKNWKSSFSKAKPKPNIRVEAEKIKGGKAENMTPKDLAKKHDVSIKDIEKEIEVGVKIEMEHTDSKEKAKEIAMDHIAEFPDYYTNKKYGTIASEKGLEKVNEEESTYTIKDDVGRILKTIKTAKPQHKETILKMVSNLEKKYQKKYGEKEKFVELIGTLREKVGKKFDIEETTTTGALGSSPIQPLGTDINRGKLNKSVSSDVVTKGNLKNPMGMVYTIKPKTESRIIKVSDLLNETTTTGSITSTVDFIVNNLLGWGDKADLSPVWPSPKRKSDNGKQEDWWWQKKPIYNGGVITDPYAKTNETWDDEELEVTIDQDLSMFKREIEKNPKKYKQDVIDSNKAFDANIDSVGVRWVNYSDHERIVTIKEGLNEVKKDKDIHTAKWKRCFEKVSKEKGDESAAGICTDSIGYEGSIKKAHRKKDKEEIEETTTFSSVWGSNGPPVTPAFAAKKGKHGPSKKPIWKGGKIIQKIENDGVLNELNSIKWVKGGKFVKIKDKCSKFNNQPWCDAGNASNPLELSDTTFENVKRVSEKTGLSEQEILERIKNKFL